METRKEPTLAGWMKDHSNGALREYGETVLRLTEKFDLAEPRGLAEYPLGESLFPILAFQIKSSRVIVRHEPGRWPNAFLVSVEAASPVHSLFGLFDPTLDLSGSRIPGMNPEWLFTSYSKDQKRFSCELEDEWDLAMLFRILKSMGLLDWAAIPNRKEGDSR